MVVMKKGSFVGVVKKKKKQVADDQNISDNFELLNIEFKESEDEYFVTYAYKLKVKNHANTDVKLVGRFLFKDSDGFEVERGETEYFIVGPFKEHVEIGKVDLYNKKSASRIVDVDTKLEKCY